MNSRKRSLLVNGLIIAALFAFAFCLRFYRLQEFPPGLYVDEAANGVDALEVLDGRYSIFFERNTGREPILIYLQALAILLFGATPYALRVPAALIGALTVPAIYWMVVEAFRTDRLPSRWLGLWTALFVAFSYWHISLSRLGFRAVLLPLTATLTFIFFWRSWNRLSADRPLPWMDLILCGFFTGLSLYTYTAGRLTPVWLTLVFLFGGIQVVRSVGFSRLLFAFGTITGVALLVFVPLGSYFLLNPDQFYGRAADVSVFNPYFAGDLPGRALMNSIMETARMFVDRADPNLRHNPAGQPVFDLLMAAWLLTGLILAVVRIRLLPYFFALSGFLIFAVPAVITAEGLPHSLRAIGMLPMAYLLAVIAMMVAGRWLSRWVEWAAVWTPLPFFLFSAFIGTQSYFDAWQDLDRFRGPFLSDFQKIDMSTYGDADGVWIWPFSPNYHWSDNTFYPLEYLHHGESDYGFVTVDDRTAAAAMADLTEGKSEVYLVRTHQMPDVFAASYVMGDPKHLVEFVLEKHAYPGEVFDADDMDDVDGSIPFQLFQLPAESDYAVYNQFEPNEFSFADQVKLLGFDMGGAAIGPGAPIDLEDDIAGIPPGVSTDGVPAGEKLWIVLNWEAAAPVGIDLKTSLVLRDQSGNLAGQVDDLLVGDRYPVERIWQPGEQTNSYHILPLWAGLAPGAYDLSLRIYEDGTQRTYPIVDQNGAPLGSEAPLGVVHVGSAVRKQHVEPGIPLDPALSFYSGLNLIGYDLPKAQVAPGETVPIVLYWQAERPPASDLGLTLTLTLIPTGAEEQPTATEESPIGGDAFPTGQWRAGEVVRDWQSLTVPGEAALGVYELTLNAGDSTQASDAVQLGEITVEGRPRSFEIPPLSQPLNARFGQTVELLGLNAPVDLIAEPGELATFELVWQVMDAPQDSLIRFVHVLGEDGVPVAQQDIVPCGGACPTPTWLAQEILIDPVTIQIPDDLAPGDYQLVTGWYDPDTFQRLAVAGEIGEAQTEVVALPFLLEVR